MSYKEALQYLDSFINYEKFPSFNYEGSLKLERMGALMEKLGNPHLGLRCIHISGTKGKGSTSAMVASILREAGYEVGLYTSPHLISFRERIRINDEFISESELCNFLDKIKPAIDGIDKESDMCPTFFEIYTALAFCYFRYKRVDFCVAEVGLGGRLDATNIIQQPLCCGITQISYEHTQKLGSTLQEIAAEKAGILKEGTICVSSLQDDAAGDVIRKFCRETHSRLYEVGKDILFRVESYVQGEQNRRPFSVAGIFGEYPFLESALMGRHQFMNAATAVGLIESLRFYDIIVSTEAIKEGLKNVKWPGRLQVLQKDPHIILDGAQNRASAKALREAIKEFFSYDRLILVLGISKDKDINGICEELGSISDEIILTKAKTPRAEEPSVLKGYIKKDARLTNSIEEAFTTAQGIAGSLDLILVTGSLFVVGEALEKFQYISVG